MGLGVVKHRRVGAESVAARDRIQAREPKTAGNF